MKALIAVEDILFGNAIADLVCKHKWPAGTEFKVVHAISPVMLDHPMSAYPLFLESLSEETLKEARKLVHHVAHRLRDGLSGDCQVTEQILEGAPSQAVIAEAKSWPSDLIVLGSHGRHGFERFLIGSVSLGVAAHAPCSVLVVRLPAQSQS